MKRSFFLRSYDRDEVLGHVKQHYIDAGLFITSAAAAAAHTPKPLIQIPPPKLDFMTQFAMLEPQQSRIVSNLMQVMPDITIKTPALLPPPNGETTNSSVSQMPDQITSILANNNNNQLLLASNSPSTEVEQGYNDQNNLHHNMVVAMQLAGGDGTTGPFKIPKLPTTSTTTTTNTNTKNNSNNSINTIATTSSSVTNAGTSTGQVQGSSGTTTSNSNSNTSSSNNSTWRGPAPYRCGHCHQVSNWKHVIQVFY